MDDLEINAAAINGQGQGALTRVAVDGRVFALMSGGGRVASRRVVYGAGQAILSGGGRVNVRNETAREALALGSGSRAATIRRALVDGQGAAQAHAVAKVVRRVQLPVAVAAEGVHVPHVTRRGLVDGTASASGVAQSRATRRTPVLGYAAAEGAAGGTIYPRRDVRHLVTGNAEAVGSVQLRGIFSVPVNGLVFARLLGSGGGINNQFPFDEPAPLERRLSAPQRPPTFTVTEMPLVGTATQQPRDIYDYDIDFSTWFPPNDNIISATVTSSPPMPQPPSAAISGLTVKVWVYDEGTSGLTYTLTLLAITADGRQKEVELQIKVKEE